MQDIQLSLTIEETQKLLAALGKFPYAEVFQLIQKVEAQANACVAQSRKATADA